jgi:hypothetical protein
MQEPAMPTPPSSQDPRRPRRTRHRWPDTTDVPPPHGDAYACADWLLGRHSALAELVARVRDVVYEPPDSPGGVVLDLDALADAILDLDAAHAAWVEYTRSHPEPGYGATDVAYEAWQSAGPPRAAGAAHDIAVMSSTEATRLRLLAVFAPAGARISAVHLRGLDPGGRVLLADWCRALYAA